MVIENHKPVLIVIAGPNGSGGGHDVPITKVISRYYKSILNCKRCATIVDRLYIYDNSIDDADASLLFRMTDGKLFKKYKEEIPEWAMPLLK